MVRAFELTCHRCPGGHALSNSHRDCDACSFPFADDNAHFNAHSRPHGCAIRNLHADANSYALSHPYPDPHASADGDSTSSRTFAVAAP